MTETQTTPIANVEMAALWDGEEGDDWTENAERYDATDQWIASRYDTLVEIAPADAVLDVGCGTGKWTRTVARRAPAGSVLAVDLSSRMLEHARRQSAVEGLDNITYLRADAQVHPFEPAHFDLAVSSFGAMFFDDPVAAFANIGRALRPGGRLAFLAWQRFEDNEWLTTIFDAMASGRDLPAPAAGDPGPFGLADHDAVMRLLRSAGYVDAALTPIVEPFCAGRDEEDAWAFISAMGPVQGLSEGLEPSERAAALDTLRAAVAAHATDEGVLFGSAAWLISARWP